MIELERKIELIKHDLKFKRNVVYLKKEENEYIHKYLVVLLKTAANDFDSLTKEEFEIFILFSNMKRITDGEIPRYIYRYDGCDNAKKSIEGKYIWMSSNLNFNDPFEGILHGDYENAKDSEIVNLYSKIFSYSESEVLGLIKDSEKRKDYVERIKEHHKKNVSNAGIFCCSEINDSITMWSHYAEKHKGVCLEYDVLEDTSFFQFVKKVSYTENFPEKATLSEILNNLDNSLLYISILTKSAYWEKEKEVRVIETNQKGKIEIKNLDCLKSVIFGLNCEKKFKRKLIEIMREKGYNKNTEIKKAVKAENAYKLNIETVGTLNDPIINLIK